ncbi:peptidoglycan editing factor PgeF [Virgibacillus sp. C22-A2]|uniref:Purine nucleoside phosphorylase n=1 Tax=Virgibacillus tibetensis TaxID=3042313 RepID=A0ABU6KCY0_9BACI|nr:peptidoglycan editing factor PgeF [Virgibacillus sp. C22-A2]
MSELFKHCNELHLHIEKWQKLSPNLTVGFTTKNGGISKAPYDTLNCGLHVADTYNEVIANRTKLADVLKFPLENWVSGEQVHGTVVKNVDEEAKGKGATSYQDSIKGTDGLITNKPGILCTAFFADCVPLFFFDPITGYIGIAHAGWKGTVGGMAKEMIQKFEAAGVTKSDLLVAIGPCISGEAYEVDEHVISHISDKYKKKAVTPKGNNRYLLDLKQLNVEILLQCGVLRNNIDVTNYCTFYDNQLFFSHRRDNGKTGRMLGYIGYSI